jgi:hypothetical protein
VTGTMGDWTRLGTARRFARRDLVVTMIVLPLAGSGAAACGRRFIEPVSRPPTVYVAPTGSDAAPGVSPRQPWRSLATVRARTSAGAHVRLAPGRWRETLEIGAEGIKVEAR